MNKEIELTKRSKTERLAIANTLIDSVMRETKNGIINKNLNDCLVTLSDCIELIVD